MLKNILSLFCILAALAMAPLSASHAQTVKVVAVVDGQVITSFDLENRLKFLLAATGLIETDDNADQLRQDVLQMLIDDKLKMAEADKLSPGLTQAARTQARDYVNDSYKTDSLTAGQNIKQLGLNRQIIEDKFASDLTWSTLLRERYKTQFENADKLAEQALARFERDISQPQVKLSEIVLAPAPDRSTNVNLDIASQMIDAIRQGADFAAIAKQYSAAGSASNGGKLGWLTIKSLPDAFKEPVEAAASGSILEPLAIDGIVYILRNEGVRAQGLIDPSQMKLTIARALLPLSADVSNADQLIAAGELQKQSASLTSCAEINALNQKLGSGQPSFLRDLELGSITPNLRQIIEKLDVNEPSEPLNFAEGMVTFMICERTMPEIDMPDLKELEAQELNKIFAILSNRYLLRLRRSATIEKR